MSELVAVLPHNSNQPAYSVTREQAREMRSSGQAYFVNHGKDLRLTPPKEMDYELILAGGSMRDSWHIRESGGYPVWQMRAHVTT